MSKDYYEILGVSKSASKDEIKKAFHKQAHKYHPDKKDGDEAKFKEANEAYQTLSDDSKRAQYDQFGSAGPQGFGGGGFGGGQGGFGGFDFSQGQGGFDMGDLNDIFSDFFGGGMGGGRGRSRRGRDISTEISISFEESVFGVTKKIAISKQSACKTCKGSGAKDSGVETCKKCKGAGQIREAKRTFMGTFETNRMCDDCDGAGKVPKEKCSTCHGSGVTKGQEELEVNIPAGIQNGQMVRLTGMGEAITRGQAGDLFIKINIPPHKTFTRDGFNLHTDLHVKLTDALLGAEHTLHTLDGDVKIKIPEGINHGEMLRIKERGVPNGARGKRGDIYVHVLIKIPHKLSRKERELVEGLKEEGL